MKKARKTRMLIPILIVLCIIVIITCIAFIIYILSGNYITYSKEYTSNTIPSEAIIKESNVIIYNGILLGSSKDGVWIPAEKYYEAKAGTNNIEVNLYSKESLYGTFNTASIRKHREGLIYTTIGKDTLPEQYLAISSNVSKNLVFAKQVEGTKQDEKYVKEALGSYKFLNSGVKITEIYSANIEGINDKIICATAKKAGILGVYSAVVYVTNNEAYLVKYAYVRDTKNAESWPVYSVKYIKDLNGDNKPELILEEVTGNFVHYTVQELRDNHTFYQVLRVGIEL
ncbi:MAG: hypothetical protein IKL68_04135 [Clostridia bacterium]|nr:hypothetical protein [Clostridia bacterium]